jgi:hypothetical protein
MNGICERCEVCRERERSWDVGNSLVSEGI